MWTVICRPKEKGGVWRFQSKDGSGTLCYVEDATRRMAEVRVYEDKKEAQSHARELDVQYPSFQHRLHKLSDDELLIIMAEQVI